jgi:hypothetical protein
MYPGHHKNNPLYLSNYNKTYIFSTDFQKNNQMPNFMEIHPAGAELFHVAKCTVRDMTQLCHFSHFCKRDKKWVKIKGQTQNSNIHKLGDSILYKLTIQKKGKIFSSTCMGGKHPPPPPHTQTHILLQTHKCNTYLLLVDKI